MKKLCKNIINWVSFWYSDGKDSVFFDHPCLHKKHGRPDQKHAKMNEHTKFELDEMHVALCGIAG